MKKNAIIGAAKYGKSSVIDELEKRGYEVVREAARDVIAAIHERTGKLIKEDPLGLQYMIVSEQVKRESQLKGPISFIDRGLVDVLAYAERSGIDLPQILLDVCENTKYDRVFMLEEIELTGSEGIKTSTPEVQRRTQELLLKHYTAQGYAPIIVPAMSVEERADFILDKIGEKG